MKILYEHMHMHISKINMNRHVPQNYRPMLALYPGSPADLFKLVIGPGDKARLMLVVSKSLKK